MKKGKARLFGVVLAAMSAFSMVATPAYSAAPAGGKRVSFQTSAAVLEYVKVKNPDLYQRLIQYRSGQGVKVTAREHAYLKKLNRIVVAQQKAKPQYEFSSQSRVSQEARAAHAQAKPKTAVTVTPKPWWDFWVEQLPNIAKGAGLFALAFPVIAPVVLVINIILIIVEAIAKIAETMTPK